MNLSNKSVLVLGAWGLVGRAICRRLLADNPERLIACSLSKEEATSLESQIASYRGGADTKIVTDYGDIFVRTDFADQRRSEILADKASRGVLLNDIFERLDSSQLESSYLFGLLQKPRPHVVVDCINTATAFAYQNVHGKVRSVRKRIDRTEEDADDAKLLAAEIEEMLAALPIPQLIHHMHTLYESLRAANVRAYLKVGTTGTGGMGINIPYTHSEDRPSRMLLTKAAIAGAQTHLLFLMGRTPEGPVVKEVKPASAIAWKAIGYGPILRGGVPIQLYDCLPEDGVSLENAKEISTEKIWQELEGNFLESVYLDAGENGLFSLAEFEAISSSGQMEFITPEEIAEVVLLELRGVNTGRDTVSALDSSILTPSYRAGVMRASAIEEMQRLEVEHKNESIAFENLGPPRLSKLLYEAHILRMARGTLRKLEESSPGELSSDAERLIREDQRLRAGIISIGLAILLSDGKTILRGPVLKNPAADETANAVTLDNIDRWAAKGWVDLRESNMSLWRDRAGRILAEVGSLSNGDTSSYPQRNRRYWNGEETLPIGKVAGWILEKEDGAFRLK